MTRNRTVIGSGVRVETRDPAVVADTIVAKDKLAELDEDIRVEKLSRLECLRLTEKAMRAKMDEAIAAVAKARDEYHEALHGWSMAHWDMTEEERNAG